MLIGFEKPSAIQQRGIVPFCKGLDVIQQAQSGTGKTAVLSELELLIIKVKVSTTPDGKVLDLFFIIDTRFLHILFATL